MSRKLLRIGQAANHYVHRIILKSSTQLDNNSLSQSSFFALHKAIKDIRIEIKEHGQFDIEDINVAHFRNTVKITEKYSLGNCQEQAIVALDFIFKNHPNIRAEVFCIQSKQKGIRGDHAFLVLGRPVGSDPTDPFTFGNAIFCDPWGQKVYNARDYLKYLKNFHYIITPQGIKNAVEKFDPLKYSIAPFQLCNTDYLKQHFTVAELEKNFRKQINHFKYEAIELGDRLIKQTSLLSKKNVNQLFDLHKRILAFQNYIDESENSFINSENNIDYTTMLVLGKKKLVEINKYLNNLKLEEKDLYQKKSYLNRLTRLFSPEIRLEERAANDTPKLSHP